ncbi:MAG: family transporter [Segetibacter sp.]|nr:family transporter [Segetibacter sp.]
MNNRNNEVPIAGFIITLVAAILFSTKAIIIKLAFAATGANAVTMITLRMIFSLPFYIAAAFFISNNKENIRMTNKQWMLVLGLGLIGYYMSSMFDFIGLQYVSAGLERLILFLYPTFAVLINAGVYKQKISRVQSIALTLTYAGIAIAFFGELQVDNNNPNFLWGSFMIFLCAVTFSVYMVGSGRIIPIIGSAKFTAYVMLAATVGVFVHFAVTSNVSTLASGNGLWFYGILLAIVATVIPSFMMSNGMKRIGSNNVAIINSIGPVSTILQAHFLLEEKMFAAQVVGTLLVMAGVLLIGWKSRTTAVL